MLPKYVNEQLAQHEGLQVELHVQNCLDCQGALDRLTADSWAEPDAWRRPEPPEPYNGEEMIRRVQAKLELQQSPGRLASSGDVSVLPVSIPGYEFIGELGRGGMGVVYKARQVAADRIVALKMILAGKHASRDDLRRFQTEAQAVARLQHPHVVQIFEIGEHDGMPFFSLEWCDGGSLGNKLEAGPLPARDAATIVEKLADAVQCAHEKGVIHRDLKPTNILLTGDGTAKIADFGLAKKVDATEQTRSGAVMGTPNYMAPEQARGERAGPPADIYALGAILYKCLTGGPPFEAESGMQTLLQVLNDEPVLPSNLQRHVPLDLETICMKCLKKEPEQRYGSAQELAEDLRRFRQGEQISAGCIDYREHWEDSHPADWSGQVWIQLIPRPENRGKAHVYTVRWGVKVYRNEESFPSCSSAILVHTKGANGLSVPIHLDISPPCNVRFGHGDPPREGIDRDINGWWSFSFLPPCGPSAVLRFLKCLLDLVRGLGRSLGLVRQPPPKELSRGRKRQN